MTNRIYLDYNATTPVADEVVECIRDSIINHWENPSSIYPSGEKTKEVIENSRKKVAHMIGAESHEIVFTSGGTESNNLVFHSLVSVTDKVQIDSESVEQSIFTNGNHTPLPDQNVCFSNGDGSLPHVIISCIEHDSVLLTARMYEKQSKIRLTELKINSRSGQVDLNHLKENLCKHTRLVSVMLANNETGIIQPIQEISKMLKEYTSTSNSHPILLHTDAAQAIGKISVSVNELGVDYLTIAGHKFYGPRTGALYVRNHLQDNAAPLIPMLYGGGQENGYRPGTENTAMIVGLGKAAELVSSNLKLYQQKMGSICDLLEKELINQLSPFYKDVTLKMLSWFPNNMNPYLGTSSHVLVKNLTHRLPNTCNVALCFNKYPQTTGSMILSRCISICASVGSACHGANSNGSKVLVNCGKHPSIARAAIRLSVGRETTENDVKLAVEDIKNAMKEILKEKERDCMNGELVLDCKRESISNGDC